MVVIRPKHCSFVDSRDALREPVYDVVEMIEMTKSFAYDLIRAKRVFPFSLPDDPRDRHDRSLIVPRSQLA